MRDARDGIARYIRDRGFKQAAIAAKVGLTDQQLCDILKKRRKLDANEMFMLCEAMNISPDQLFKPTEEVNQ